MSLNMNASLHLVGRPGRTFNEQGSVSGSLSGTVSSRFTAITATEGSGTFVVYLKGGSFSGVATTHGRVVGATVYFSGKGKITGGSGTWAHASGANLRYSGTMDRQNLRVTEHLSGSIAY